MTKRKIPSEYKDFSDDLLPSRAILGSSIQFLHLTENIFQETLANNNSHFYHGDPISDEKFEKLTKWSDFNIIRPVLFNFYHGLELLMKGLLLAIEEDFETNHKLCDLAKKIWLAQDIPVSIKNTLKRHLNEKILPEPIKTFTKTNNLTVSELYEYFRYPINKDKSHIFEYNSLEYQGNKMISYLEIVVEDSLSLRIGCVKFLKQKNNKVVKNY